MALWTPAEITTALWLDAADTNTITLNGGNVSQWDDKSGEERHVSQPSSTLQPGYTAGSHLSFDGVDDFLSAGSNYLYATAEDGGMTSFVVASSWNDEQNLASFVYDSGNYLIAGYGVLINPRRIRLYTSSEVIDDDPYPLLGNSYNVVSTRVAFENSQTIYLNGSQFATGAMTLAELTATQITNFPSRSSSGGPFVLGRQSKTFSDAGRALHGNLRELILVRGALDDADRQRIEGYLAHRWGLESNLPTGHPYIQFPPGYAEPYRFTHHPRLHKVIPTLSSPTVTDIGAACVRPRVTKGY